MKTYPINGNTIEPISPIIFDSRMRAREFPLETLFGFYCILRLD